MALMSLYITLTKLLIKLDFKVGFYKSNYTGLVHFFWLIKKMCSTLPQN